MRRAATRAGSLFAVLMFCESRAERHVSRCFIKGDRHAIRAGGGWKCRDGEEGNRYWNSVTDFATLKVNFLLK